MRSEPTHKGCGNCYWLRSICSYHNCWLHAKRVNIFQGACEDWEDYRDEDGNPREKEYLNWEDEDY